MGMKTTIAVEMPTWKALKQLQLDLNLGTMDEVINVLLTVRNTDRRKAV